LASGFDGVALVIAVEVLGVARWPFATGSYLSIATTGAMFAGGLVRALVEATTRKKTKAKPAPRSLLKWTNRRRRRLRPAWHHHRSSAGPEISNRVPHWLTSVFGLPWRADLFAFGPKLMGSLATNNIFGIFMFALLAASLFYFARKKLD